MPDVPTDRSDDFRASRLRQCIAALDLMTAKTEQMLSDLESHVPIDAEHVRPERSNILQMYVTRIDQSVENRCRNLRSTLRAIDRERQRAQSELNGGSRALG